MGIPRLSQDLLPYAEQVSLGGFSANIEAARYSVDSLIIDGPSLVYFVFNKLLAYHSQHSVTPATSAPSYSEINEATSHLLSSFQANGVTIQAIFFDGGLPEAKRDIRLDRLEKLRVQLETYRKVYPEFPMRAKLPQATPIDFDHVVWRTSPLSIRRLVLPAPPFMVASVTESLHVGRWKHVVHVVPGEADIFCAQAAKDFDGQVGILTNDSDLSVYDLGSKPRVVLLNSIEKKEQTKDSSIIALALHSSSIADRLKVSSLLRLGFERHLDPSISTGIVIERARDDSRLELYASEYSAFCNQYMSPSPADINSRRNIDSLDPRTAELIVDTSDAPHVYMAPLLEDPSRDSSWSYGAEIRQLSYSLLKKVAKKHVAEYARKGQRIVSRVVPVLGRQQIHERAVDVLEFLETASSALSATPLAPSASLLEWYIVALRIVHQQKRSAGKQAPNSTQIIHLLGLSSIPAARTSWEDVHLLANAHAVLYSLRMLKQITTCIINHSPPESDDCELPLDRLRELNSRLEPLPPIASLFLDIPDLHSQIGSNLDLETRNGAIMRLRKSLDLEDGADNNNAEIQGPGDDQMEQQWTSTAPNKKKKRKSSLRDEAVVAPQTMHGSNSFGLLMEE